MTRSPFYFQSQNGTESTLGIKIWTGSGSAVPSSFTYELNKSHTDGVATHEISELLNDYISQSFSGTNASYIPNYAYFRLTQSESGSGAVYGTPTESFTMMALEGYIDNNSTVQYYRNNFNYSLQEYYFLNEPMEYIIPEGEELKLVGNSDSFTVTPVSTISSPDFSISNTPCSKFDSKKLTFVNKYGGKSDIWFTAKSTRTDNFKSETFRSSTFDYVNLGNNQTMHSNSKIGTNGQITMTLNTDFLNDQYNELFTQLKMSEYVWFTEGGNTTPASIKDMSHTHKTHLNDGLIQYTVKIELDHSIAKNFK